MSGATTEQRGTGKDRKGRRVGVLGGSFNPAHPGHLHITEVALDLLRLDEAWWLVSPRNPLKPEKHLAPLSERVSAAQALAARERRIAVSDLERDMGTRYTVDTVTALRRRHPDAGFVWIMGADNLAELHRWKDWTRLLEQVPVAVFDRPSYSFRALKGVAARRFAAARRTRRDAGSLAIAAPPAWMFLWTTFDSASASAVRADRGERDKGPNRHPQ